MSGYDNVGGDLVSTRASDVEPQNVRWLWSGWVPLGMVSLLVGLPGRGKTTLAEQLAADVTRGRLPGDLLGHPADVLIVSYEDAVREVLIPRLIAADADRKRVHLLGCRDVGEVLDLMRQLDKIERQVREYSAKLIIIDPLVAGLPRDGVNSHRDQDVRSVLAPLAALADRHTLTVLPSMHFSKSATSALIGAGGSIGFVAAARSILVFGLDPDDERGADGPARVLAHAKCNVGRLQKSRRVDLVEDLILEHDPPIVTVRAVLGDQCDVSADELVQDRDNRMSPRVQAERFLRELLADGPHRSSEVIDLAEDADIAIRTLHRAKRDLGVESKQRKAPNGKPEWWWELPEEEGSPADPSSEEEAGQ